MEPDERRLHLFHGGLLLVCLLLDPFLRSLIGAEWRSPVLSVYPAAAALIWLAVWARQRLLLAEGKRRALEERLRRLEQRVSALEIERAPGGEWAP